MATIIQAKYKEENPDGSVILFHFQTNADIVVDGTTKKVPLITDISGWNAIRAEVITARGGSGSLDMRLDGFDTKLLADNLIAAIKTVDGPLSGLDSDSVDGCGVNDTVTSATVLWTSYKINAELGKKVDDTEVATVATANKLLKLNANGALGASVTGNSGSATKLATARTFTFGGGVSGSGSFDGTTNIQIDLNVNSNSHNHSGLILAGATTVENTGTTGNILDFKMAGVTKSSIDLNGNFTKNAASATLAAAATKLAALRTITFGGDVSGNFTFDGTADKTVNITVVDSDKVGGAIS